MAERSCLNCAHCVHETESWEMPHIGWYECRKRPHNSMLKNFPFRRTTCVLWTRAKHGGFWDLAQIAESTQTGEEAGNG